MRSIPDGFVADLMALLEIPGVAVWEHGRTDLDRAAAWLGSRLERAGLQARLLDDGISPPFVYAQTEIRPDRPTLLLYGHYDVQPASLKDGWTTDPFKPDIRNGRIYARGATDQKMNLLLPVFALEEADLFGLPFNIKVFYEGQEEIFSPGLEAALLRYKDLLRSDAVFSTDGWQSSADLGDVRLGLRGFCGLEVEVHGANKDLHSGSFGGAVPNPAQALARALSRLHDDDGMITVPGFMDDATPLTEAEKTFLVAQPFDRKAWLALTGLAEGDAPDRLELQTRMGLRPTMEINALESGNYLGGFRTIVPSSARARISCRLVPGRSPTLSADCFRISSIAPYRSALRDRSDHCRARPVPIASQRMIPFKDWRREYSPMSTANRHGIPTLAGVFRCRARSLRCLVSALPFSASAFPTKTCTASMSSAD